MKGRLKKSVRALVRRYPLLRSFGGRVIGRSRLIRLLLKRTGVATQQQLDIVSAGAVYIPPFRGLPASAAFKGPFPSRELVVLLGASYLEPNLEGLIGEITGWDKTEKEVVRASKCSFAPLAILPPYAVYSRLSECIVWYEHVVSGVPGDCETVKVRFRSPGGGGVVAAGIRCFCLLVGREDIHGRGTWVVDLSSSVPVAIQAAKGASA